MRGSEFLIALRVYASDKVRGGLVWREEALQKLNVFTRASPRKSNGLLVEMLLQFAVDLVVGLH